MIVPASYENQVMKIPINATSAELTFSESGVFMIGLCWVSTDSKSVRINFLVNDEIFRWETLYSEAGVETIGSLFMRPFKSGDSIVIQSGAVEMEITYALIRKVGNYVEN